MSLTMKSAHLVPEFSIIRYKGATGQLIKNQHNHTWLMPSKGPPIPIPRDDLVAIVYLNDPTDNLGLEKPPKHPVLQKIGQFFSKILQLERKEDDHVKF